MAKKDKRKKILKVVGLIGLFLIVFGLSYALFTVTLNGTKKVKIKTGKLELQLLDKNNNPIYSTSNNSETSYEINLDNQVPVSDEVGLDSTAFEFKLKNTGNIKASYTIYLDDVALESGEERIDDEYIRYSLTKNGSEENPQGLSSRELDKGVIDEDNTIYTYTLKIWIAEDATNEAMDKVFNATLRVEGTQYVAPESLYGTKIAERQITETITATYYQPEDTGYNNKSKVKRMSNVQRIDNEETYEGGTLVISGEGEMPDYATVKFLCGVDSNFDVDELWDNDIGGYSFKYNPETVIIETGIISIGEASFYSLKSLKNVSLPNTLSYIEIDSFTKTSLIEVSFPDSLQYINGDSFANNPQLEKVYISSIISSPNGGYAFGESPNLTIYCKTQEIKDSLSARDKGKAVVDPTKFE